MTTHRKWSAAFAVSLAVVMGAAPLAPGAVFASQPLPFNQAAVKQSRTMAAPALATRAQKPLKLLFSSQQDLVDTWGKLHISVTPVDSISANVPQSEMSRPSATGSPERRLVGCFPQADGSWKVYSQEFEKLTEGAPGKWYEGTNKWKLLRGITTDGMTFSKVETVIPDSVGTWTYHLTMAYNPDAGEYLMLKMRNTSYGFAYHAWFSRDGRNWQMHTGTREGGALFYEGDAMSVFWSPVLKRFVLVSKSLQPWKKHIIDHGGTTKSLNDDSFRDRRVLMMRSSSDGRNWTPSDDLPDVYDLHNQKAAHPQEWLTVPDADDPPDLEFYSGTAFWYHDRAYMMVLNYAASPMFPKKHAHHLDYEWWTSADGLNWERPARGVNALLARGIGRPDMGPMIIGSQLLWLTRNHLAGLAEDRISGVSARANGEFSTRIFTMPDGDLRLNAAVPSLDRPWLRRTPQPYVMVEVRDARGDVIPGFERDKCVIWDGTTSPGRDTQVNVTDKQLMWNSVSASKLAGQTICLRFYFAGSTIYSVTSNNKR
jgi:hypothetical protein